MSENQTPQIKVLVPRERTTGELRVAATPETVEKMTARGLSVCVEQGAGERAGFLDSAYEAAGAVVAEATPELWRQADIVLKVGRLEATDAGHESEWLRAEAVVIGFLAPYDEASSVAHLATARVTSLAMELVPRITRAQSMDALSSQASLAGYKAALIGAARLGRYFPLLMTAAGTIKPSRVVVMGGGVAGLQSLATAKRLGAVVEVSDIRPRRQRAGRVARRQVHRPPGARGRGRERAATPARSRPSS